MRLVNEGSHPLLLLHVSYQVRSMLTPVSAYRSHTTFQNLPLVNSLPSETSSTTWGTRRFVRLLPRQYVHVRLLNSVHARIAATGLPLPSCRVISPRRLLSSRFSNIECPRMLRFLESAGPGDDWLNSVVTIVPYQLLHAVGNPGALISELSGWPTLPLSKLHVQSHNCPRMTRGHD